MPGPVSDSYDPEWGTAANAEPIIDALEVMYDRVAGILAFSEPMDIRKLANLSGDSDLAEPIPATLTEWEWRIIRFALERAKDSI